MKPIFTMHLGKCYKLDTDHIHRGSAITFRLYLYILNDLKPEEVLIFITSNDSWHGIFTNEWPQFKPTVLNIELNKPYTG